MKDHDREEEEIVAGELGALKSLNAPPDVRSSNAAAVRAALRPARRVPWNQRAIYVPFPLAAVFIVAFAGLLAWQVFTAVSHQGSEREAPSAQREPSPAVQPSITVAAAPQERTFEKVIYVAGIGPISRVSGNIYESGEGEQ